MGRMWILWGCIFGFLSVALGAFGAHALKPLITIEQMEILKTANLYLMFHAVALLGLGLWNHWEKWSSTFVTGLCFVFGVILFSGSLYAYVLTGVRFLAMITPVGGSLFLIGWLLFAFSVIRTKSNII